MTLATKMQDLRGRGVPWAALAVGLVFAIAAYRIYRMVDLHAVDLLYWDQYTLYQAFADGAGPWELFRWQHSPHRQGVGFWVTGWIAAWSGWNTRAEAFAVWAAIVLAAWAALWLRRRLFGPLHAGDVAIPLLVLTPAQYGIFIHTSNLSHGAVPLLGLLLVCATFTLRRPALRYALLLLLDFLLVHTGFGVFVGALTPALIALLARADLREGGVGPRLPAAAFVLSLGIVALFFWGHDPGAGVARATGLQAPLRAYAGYVGLMFANVLGLKGASAAALLAGTLAAALVLAVAVEQAIRAWREPERQAAALAILGLAGFTLLYCATTAWGRLPLGLSGAQSTRYVPLVVPAFLALYLRVQQVRRPALRRGGLVTAVLVVVAATWPMRAQEARFMEHLARGKRLWVATYLETGSIDAANAAARLRAFPHDGPEFPRMLRYMREHELGIFRRDSRNREAHAER